MLLEGKKGLIVGVANKSSIAWSIAQTLHRQGAQLAFTYQGERLADKVQGLVEEEMSGAPLMECDVSRDEDIKKVFAQIDHEWNGLDFLIHSVAFANRDDLKNGFANTSRDGFKLALDISAYSLVALAREAAPLMRQGGSIIALTYLGSLRVVPGYDIMGVAKAALESSIRYLANDLGPKNIRVNGISAGPVNTLAARGIPGFLTMLKIAAEKAPLKRNTQIDEIADTALFLASSLSRGITGDLIFVDNGLHIMA